VLFVSFVVPFLQQRASDGHVTFGHVTLHSGTSTTEGRGYHEGHEEHEGWNLTRCRIV
jgi:hypothetical protein